MIGWGREPPFGLGGGGQRSSHTTREKKKPQKDNLRKKRGKEGSTENTKPT